MIITYKNAPCLKRRTGETNQTSVNEKMANTELHVEIKEGN